jgi:recombination protein RecA
VSVEKRRQLEMTVAAIRRRWGQEALRKLEARPATVEIPCIPTGFAALDQALGIGGLPKGKIVELAGPATSGKTTLALKFLAQAQVDGQVGVVDCLRVFDPDYAYRCGLDLARLLIVAPYGFEEALSMTEAIVRSGSLSAIVFDGLDISGSELYSEPLFAACLARLVAPLAQSDTVLLFLNAAVRRGILSATAGQKTGLAYHATVRLSIEREQWIRAQGDVRGYHARVEILKNRLGPSQRAVTISIRFNGTVRGDDL